MGIHIIDNEEMFGFDDIDSEVNAIVFSQGELEFEADCLIRLTEEQTFQLFEKMRDYYRANQKNIDMIVEKIELEFYQFVKKHGTYPTFIMINNDNYRELDMYRLTGRVKKYRGVVLIRTDDIEKGVVVCAS